MNTKPARHIARIAASRSGRLPRLARIREIRVTSARFPKTLVLTGLLSFWCVSSLAQGWVQFRNFYTGTTPPIDARVSFFWGGAPNASNPLWRAALIGGPTTATPASYNGPGTLQMMFYPGTGANSTISWVNFRSGSTPPIADGYVNIGSTPARAVPGVDWGGTALVQMVAWQGNYNTWEEAYAALQSGVPDVFVGFSNPLTLILPSSATSPVLTYLWGLQPFSFGSMTPPPSPYFHGIYGPYDQTVYSGEPARFDVSADASPPPYSYVWFCNGAVVPGATWYSLNIPSTSPADNGSQYYVVLNHQLGTFTSRVATLSVLTAPPVITSQPQSQTALFGDNVQFGVSATGSLPRTYQWFFNLTNAIPQATNSSLILSGVSALQSGAYTVVVSNSFGTVTSQAATLAVSDPVITAQPADRTLEVQGNVSFAVGAIGSAPLSYQWFFYVTNALLSATNSSLTLPGASFPQSGAYSVQVSNPFGSVTSRLATLTVFDPVITAQPVDSTVTVHGNASFTVTAIGSPPLSYQWLLNGSLISGAHASNLQLTNLLYSQAGAYQAVVSGPYGSVTSTPAVLTVVPRGPTYTVLHSFTGGEGGVGPAPNLILDNETLYGTTVAGGTNGGGTVFKVNTNGSGFMVLKHFPEATSEQWPWGGVVASGGRLYGTTWGDGDPLSRGGALFALNMDGSEYAVLHWFGFDDGYEPYGTLLVSGTTLFGTTSMGGTDGDGIIFRLGVDGQDWSVLKNFTGQDGASSQSGLIASGTTLFGTTQIGGTPWDSGMLFRMEMDGSGYRVLKQFSGSDGSRPGDKLTLSGTTLYGTTHYGGSSGNGTIFKLNTDGTGFSVLKHFPADGTESDPWAALVLCGETLYGTLYEGGATSRGAVFRINTDGSEYAVVKRFTGGADGAVPTALLLSGSTLYGVAQGGGISNCGVLFAMSLPLPNVVSPPSSQTAEAGSSVVFRVQADEDPLVTYQWLFNGTNVLSGPATNSVLSLPGPQFSDAGVYSVILNNAFGAVTSAPVMLSVIPKVERRPIAALSLSGSTGQFIHLETAPAFQHGPNWLPFDTVALTNAGQLYLDSRPLSTQCFYRAWQSQNGGTAPSQGLHLIPAIKLTGAAGTSVRLDYINQFGPTDAWVALATVTLTNTSQEYFDTSAIGRPARLYRLVPR